MVRKYDPVLNINTGTISPRTSVTDENPVIFRRVDADTAHAIMSGKVKAEDVIEAINRIERDAPDFNWKEYDKKRRAAEKQLNVSQREMIPVNDDPNEEKKSEGEGDASVISLKELGLGAKEKARTKAKADSEKNHKEPVGSESANVDIDLNI